MHERGKSFRFSRIHCEKEEKLKGKNSKRLSQIVDSERRKRNLTPNYDRKIFLTCSQVIQKSLTEK